MEAGIGMKEVSMAGCGIEILLLERHLLDLAGGMWDSFRIDGGRRENRR